MKSTTIALIIVGSIALITAAKVAAPTSEFYHTVQTEKVVPNLPNVHKTTLWLISRDTTIKDKDNTDKGCGATAVDRNVVATSTHCLADAGEAKDVINLDLRPVQILHREDDGQDNTLLKVNVNFRYHSKLSKRNPTWGDEVFIFGNPGTLVDMYRHGNVMGFAAPTRKTDSQWTLIDMNIGKGDSGSGIFNSYGEVIGLVSEVSLADAREQEQAFVTAKVMAFHPLQFTPKQLEAVGLDR